MKRYFFRLNRLLAGIVSTIKLNNVSLTAIILIIIFTTPNSSATTQNQTLTWEIKNLSPFPVKVNFYSRSGRTWSGPYLNSGEASSSPLSCSSGEEIGYGASSYDNSVYWGKGADGQSTCLNCYYTCNGGETVVKLLMTPYQKEIYDATLTAILELAKEIIKLERALAELEAELVRYQERIDEINAAAKMALDADLVRYQKELANIMADSIASQRANEAFNIAKKIADQEAAIVGHRKRVTSEASNTTDPVRASEANLLDNELKDRQVELAKERERITNKAEAIASKQTEIAKEAKTLAENIKVKAPSSESDGVTFKYNGFTIVITIAAILGIFRGLWSWFKNDSKKRDN